MSIPATKVAPVSRTSAEDVRGRYPDLEPTFVPLFESVRAFTMTSIERSYGLFNAIQYLVRAGVEGDILECGVWRGGSMMLAALALKQLDDVSRRLWLFDTFEGMTEPTAHDIDFQGSNAKHTLRQRGIASFDKWCLAPLEEVRRNMSATSYPEDLVEYVVGSVENTIPSCAPQRIALLRLDTDWYESTRHELEHLYPRLASGGVLIIDDYGHWRGCRKAVDEFFASQQHPILLHRMDYTGRSGVKP